MNTVILFALIIAGVSAAIVPESEVQPVETRNERFISDSIISVIEDLSQGIRDAGFDPLQVQSETYSYELPVPVIFNAAAFVEQVLSTGLSNIVVNNMNYNVILSRLNFDIELPHIHLSTRAAAGEVILFGRTLEAQVDGSVDVRRIRAVGQVRVSIGIISGISISRVTMDLSVGSIRSNIRLAVQGNNYSQLINTLISSTIPDILDEFKTEIDELLAIIIRDVANDIL